MNKPYLVTVASFTDGCKRFAKSLEHIKDQVEHIHISFEPAIPYFPAWKKYEEGYCGNLKRFDYIPNLDEKRFIIFSDTDDVVFQRPFPDLERMNYEVYLANENVKHVDSFWKPYIERNTYFEPLMQRNVYNGGLFAMRYYVFKKYMAFVKEFIKWIKPEDRGVADQLLFNLFFAKNPYYDVYAGLDVFCPLYRNIEIQSVYVKKGLFVLSDGHVPVAVHANGNTKLVLDDGRKIDKLKKFRKERANAVQSVGDSNVPQP